MNHLILNVEGIAALTFLLAILWRAAPVPRAAPEIAPVREPIAVALVALLTVLPFLRALGFPLLHDSYDLVYVANVDSAREIPHLFAMADPTGDQFFRPVAFSLFWVYARFAHYDATLWHALCLAGHAANAVLVFALGRKLRFGTWSSAFAALVFAWHGTRPEAVAWVATRVDIFATFFVLTVLVCSLDYLNRPRRWMLILVCVCCVCAVYSKEAAFTVPVLFVCLAPFWADDRRGVRIAAMLTVISGAAFVYRWLVLKGIGGYGSATGKPMALNVRPLKTIEALFFREWAIAFFPINWSEPHVVIRAGLVLLAAALLLAVVTARGNRRHLAASLGFVICAMLPAQSLALIGTDLNGARVLYLPLIGFALFWAILLQAESRWQLRIALAATFLGFELCTLTHNLNIWAEVAYESKQVCMHAADLVAAEGPVWNAEDLPRKRKGVFFLSNGFPICVMLNSGGRLSSPPPIVQQSNPKRPYIRWNESAADIEVVR